MAIFVGIGTTHLTAQETSLFQKGRAAYEQKDYATAMDFFSQAMLRRPYDKEIQKYLIDTGQRMLEDEAHQKTISLMTLQKIVDQAQKMLEQRRTEMEQTLVRLKKANSQSQLRDPQALVEACRGVDLLMEISLGDDPESQEIKKYLHSLCENLKKSMDAGTPVGQHEIHKILGYIAFCRSRWSEAIGEWEQTLEANPQDGHLQRLLVEARKRYSIEQRDKQIAGLMAQAEQQSHAKDNRKAAATLEKVLALDPAHEAARKLLETAQNRIREDVRNTAIAKNKQSAKENQRTGKWIDAAQSWLNVLELDPLDSEARESLDKIKKNISKSLLAVSPAKTQKSWQANPSDSKKSQEFYTLGLVNYSEGNLEKARENFQKSLEFDPSNDLAERALKRVQGELKYAP